LEVDPAADSGQDSQVEHCSNPLAVLYRSTLPILLGESIPYRRIGGKVVKQRYRVKCLYR
jgi:hypothetical protein